MGKRKKKQGSSDKDSSEVTKLFLLLAAMSITIILSLAMSGVGTDIIQTAISLTTLFIVFFAFCFPMMDRKEARAKEEERWSEERVLREKELEQRRLDLELETKKWNDMMEQMNKKDEEQWRRYDALLQELVSARK